MFATKCAFAECRVQHRAEQDRDSSRVSCAVCARAHSSPISSCMTRRTSHVTRHTSHVTRHTSHVTRHTSHVTRRTSPDTCTAMIRRCLQKAPMMMGEHQVPLCCCCRRCLHPCSDHCPSSLSRFLISSACSEWQFHNPDNI